jgi:hypothetical protein
MVFYHWSAHKNKQKKTFTLFKKPYFIRRDALIKTRISTGWKYLDYWNLTQLNFGPRVMKTNTTNPIKDFVKNPINKKKKRGKNRKLTIITGTCFCVRVLVFFQGQTLVFNNSHKPDTVNPSLLTLLWTTLIEGKNREGRWSYSTRRQNHQLIQKSDSWQNPTSKRYYRPFKKRRSSAAESILHPSQYKQNTS